MKLTGQVCAVETTDNGTICVKLNCDEFSNAGVFMERREVQVDLPRRLARSYPVGRKVTITVEPLP